MQHNIPEFLLELLLKQYGKNTTKSILKGYSNNRPITLRANTLKTSINYIKNTLNTLNISFKNVPWYTDALILENTSEEQIKNLDIYKEGFIYLQNLSSMIPPIILNPQENENILDMAAAPGGKTTQMLALSQNKAFITACEKNKIRAERLKYNINKQNANRVNVMTKDSRNLDDFFSFDKILLDAPCSGSGTINLSNNNLEKIFTKDLINRSTKFQHQLLTKAVKLIKPGHDIIYSTCSILSVENENIVQDFINSNKLQIIPIDKNVFPDIHFLPTSIAGTLCIAPSELYEGFFVAKIKKH